MAVIQTGDIFKSFTFDGQDSRTYGIYITGEAVYNAPERSVEMISIPGRNGAYALDNGRFENIEVTYPAGCFGNTEADFRDAISNIRNMLCSRKGYVRLTDDYNPNEYRLAVYKSGLEVTPAHLLAGEFDITFDCKPQRFLTSGETKQTLTSGDTVTNPTLFDSGPMVEATGYGTLNIDGEEIVVKNVLIGDVIAAAGGVYYSEQSCTITLETQYANPGDDITISTVGITDELWKVDSGLISSATKSGSNCSISLSPMPSAFVAPSIYMGDISFNYGTSGTFTAVGTINLTTAVYGELSGTITAVVAYNGSDTITITATTVLPSHFTSDGIHALIHGIVMLNSTKSANGNPMYIDLDIGEAYKVEGGVTVSVNNAAQLPAELPTLKPGANVITFDNTFTKIEIVPRWWKI